MGGRDSYLASEIKVALHVELSLLGRLGLFGRRLWRRTGRGWVRSFIWLGFGLGAMVGLAGFGCVAGRPMVVAPQRSDVARDPGTWLMEGPSVELDRKEVVVGVGFLSAADGVSLELVQLRLAHGVDVGDLLGRHGACLILRCVSH
jgi:hypothetical protein